MERHAVKLRDYQEEAVSAIFAALNGKPRGTGTGIAKRVAVVKPTGTGKTVTFSALALRWLAEHGGRVLVLVHRDELIKQAQAKLHAAAVALGRRDLRIGIVKAGRNEVHCDVVIGSVQTLARERRRDQLRGVGLVIVDECHHANARSYVDVLEHYGCFSDPGQGAPAAGFTATLVRADKLRPGDIWQEVVFQRDIVWAIREGHLVDIKGKRVQIKDLDLAGVRRSGGDLDSGQLGHRLLDCGAPEQLATAYGEHASTRLGMVFWPGVSTALEGQRAFSAAGIPSASVLGDTPEDDRQKIYDATWAGDVQVLHSVGVLTEGFDLPPISCVVPRMTQSPGLYVQMAGRGARPWPHPVPGFPIKKDCLLLDPVGVTGRHKLSTMADLSMTVREVRDGETLADAADRAELEELEEEAARAERNATAELEELEHQQELRRQERVAKEVSLFADSASTWLQTPRGTWFVPVAGWVLFLWPEGGGMFAVGTVPIGGKLVDAQVIERGMLLSGAMQYAEELAIQADPKGASARTAAWRNSPTASYRRVQYARSLGIKVRKTMTEADVADAIMRLTVSRQLDV